MGLLKRLRKPLVLCVDDDPLVLEVLVEVLRGMRCRALTAKDGKEALDLAREKRPALILMDMHMPVVDGKTALEFLKRDPRTKGVPVVLLSARYISGRQLPDKSVSLLDTACARVAIGQAATPSAQAFSASAARASAFWAPRIRGRDRRAAARQASSAALRVSSGCAAASSAGARDREPRSASIPRATSARCRVSITPMLRPVLAIRAFDRLRVLAHPLVALPLWAAAVPRAGRTSHGVKVGAIAQAVT